MSIFDNPNVQNIYDELDSFKDKTKTAAQQ